jgi:CBS domain-containing protein
VSESQLRAEDIMTTDVVTVGPEDTIDRVVSIMLEKNIGSVIVTGEKKNIIGIVTERDLISKVLAKGRNPKEVRVKEIMSRPVVTIDPDTTIGEAAKIMQSRGIGHLPVVKNGRVVGIIAEGDVILLAPEFLEVLRLKREHT